MNITIHKNLEKLRIAIERYQIDGYIITSSDEYNNEYVPLRNKRLEFISGFTGSNGMLFVLKTKVVLFTDGRYLNQAQKQLDNTLFEVVDLSLIYQYFDQNLVFGYDPKILTCNVIRNFDNHKILTKPIDINLVDEIWTERPLYHATQVYDYPTQYSGEDFESKFGRCIDYIKKNNAQYFCITSVDSVCWLLNLRASDIEFSPVILSYLIIGTDFIWIFTDNINVKSCVSKDNVNVLSLDQFYEFIQKEIPAASIVMIDDKSAPYKLKEVSSKFELRYGEDPCRIFKCTKNKIEIKCISDSHIKDAIAVCNTLIWIENNVKNHRDFNEYDVSIYLTHERKKQDGYIEDSFPAIVGYQDNGAIIHYRPLQNTAKMIRGDGILLIDSGAHYFGGTTDITRTILVGDLVQKEWATQYTLVLKGHIALMNQKFPNNTFGAHIDIVARQFLWNNLQDYKHGTGHGVGNAISVHEGPCGISRGYNYPLEHGMVLSNEPGFYIPGGYGIRIENLMYVNRINDEFLEFKNLTMIPYCIKLIDFSLLTKQEIEYVSRYHKEIYDRLSDKVEDKVREFLLFHMIN